MKSQKIDIIRQPIPTILATFGLLVALVTFRSLVHPSVADTATGYLSPLGEWFNSLLGPIGGTVFSLIATLTSSIIITRIISRYSISVIRSFMPMVLYMIGVGGVVFSPTNPSLHLCWLMLLRSAELLIASFKRCEMLDGVMCSAVYFILPALIVPDFVWMLWILPIEWLVYRRSAREMLAAVVAMLSPIAIVTFAWWAGSRNVGQFWEGWQGALTRPAIVDPAEFYAECGELSQTIVLGLYLLLSLMSVITFFASYTSMRLRARKIHICFTLICGAGVVMSVVGLPLSVSLPTLMIGGIPLIHTFFVKHSGVFSAIYYIVLVAATACTLVF